MRRVGDGVGERGDETARLGGVGRAGDANDRDSGDGRCEPSPGVEELEGAEGDLVGSVREEVRDLSAGGRLCRAHDDQQRPDGFSGDEGVLRRCAQEPSQGAGEPARAQQSYPGTQFEGRRGDRVEVGLGLRVAHRMPSLRETRTQCFP